MTKAAKTITYAAGIFTAFWLIIAFLITSVEAVAYWTPGYYEKEYTKYQVLNDLPEMTMDDLLDVTDEMMAFLRGKRENLHVYTTMGGEYREFFNDREIAHMEDVRGLFIGGLWLRRIGILITLCFAALAYFWGRKSAERTEALKRLIPKSLCIGTGAVFAVALALIGIISTDFSKYFIVFHKIFFNNDLWVLDPRTDMLINIVPEGFFFDTAARIALVFAGSLWYFLLEIWYYIKEPADRSVGSFYIIYRLQPCLQTAIIHSTSTVIIQSFTITGKNPFLIGCADGI